MSKRLTYVNAAPEHVAYIGAHMRDADADEAWAVSRWRPAVAAEMSVRCSTVALACLWHDEPVGLFGVMAINTLEGVGAPWAFGTDRVVQFRREWLTDAREWLTLLGDGYFVLRNYVDTRNTLARAWLKRVGFQIGDPEPYGALGLAFHPFERRV